MRSKSRIIRLILITVLALLAWPQTGGAQLQPSPAAAIAVPADYSGACGTLNPPRHNCGFKDIGLKGANGIWYIDLYANGLGGGANPPPATRWDRAYTRYGSTGVPVPADYDGDYKDDLAVKDHDGVWYIDYAANGLGSWDESHGAYGNSSAVPVPADYDGDGKADLAVKDSSGGWLIDYALDGFGSFNVVRTGYGNADSVPVPADYDGDDKADLAVKTAAGAWSIDYSANGFGGAPNPITGIRPLWDTTVTGYGDAAAIPVPADYDNDRKADLSVYSSNGDWYIDYARDGFGAWNTLPPFQGYGGSFATAVPGDYDHDGLLDLGVKANNTGHWYIDFASNGFLGWDPPTPIDNVGRQLVDTSQPHIVSTAVYTEDGKSASDLWVGVRYTVDVVLQPGNPLPTEFCASQRDNDNMLCTSNGSLIGRCRAGRCNAEAGVEVNPELQVPVLLNLRADQGSTYGVIASTSCQRHSDCGESPKGSGECNLATQRCNIHRRYAITCTQPGNHPLGFQLRNTPYGGPAFNPDYGIRVACGTARRGLYGRVTERVQDPITKVYKAGRGLANAKVTILPAHITRITDENGNWRAEVGITDLLFKESDAARAPLSGGPMTVKVSGLNCPGPSCKYSDTIAVNVMVPASGFELNTPLEEAFSELKSAGITYTTYLDYSKGRTLMHTLKVSASSAIVRVGQTPKSGSVACTDQTGPNFKLCTDPSNGPTTQCPLFHTLKSVANNIGALAVVNAVWWDLCTGLSLGYLYPTSPRLPPAPWCDGGEPVFPITSTANCTGSANTYYAEAGDRVSLIPQYTLPLFGIVGRGTNQQFSIQPSNANFREWPSSQWNQVSGSYIWDKNQNGRSDLSYALQIGNPPLVANGAVIAGGHHKWDLQGNYDYTFARTAIGVASSGVMYVVVADGEGISGGNGATGNQLGHFFHDVLEVNNALALDSGLSTEMILKGATGLRAVNTLTGEDAQIQMDPARETFWSRGLEQAGGIGSVANYLVIKRP